MGEDNGLMFDQEIDRLRAVMSDESRRQVRRDRLCLAGLLMFSGLGMFGVIGLVLWGLWNIIGRVICHFF